MSYLVTHGILRPCLPPCESLGEKNLLVVSLCFIFTKITIVSRYSKTWRSRVYPLCYRETKDKQPFETLSPSPQEFSLCLIRSLFFFIYSHHRVFDSFPHQVFQFTTTIRPIYSWLSQGVSPMTSGTTLIKISSPSSGSCSKVPNLDL